MFEEALALEQPPARDHLIEVAQCDDAERQDEMWAKIKTGEATREGLRSIKRQSPEQRDPGKALASCIKMAKSIAERLQGIDGEQLSGRSEEQFEELKVEVAAIRECVAAIDNSRPGRRGRRARGTEVAERCPPADIQ